MHWLDWIWQGFFSTPSSNVFDCSKFFGGLWVGAVTIGAPSWRPTNYACFNSLCAGLVSFPDMLWCRLMPQGKGPWNALDWNWRDSSPSSNCLLVTYFLGVCWFGHWWLSDSQLIPGETKCACSQPNFMPLGPLIWIGFARDSVPCLDFFGCGKRLLGLGRCSFLACQNSPCSGLMSCRVVGQSAYFQSNSFHAESC